MNTKLYKAGTKIPESWYTLTFKEGYSLADYLTMEFKFIKDANVLEIGGKRYAQAVTPIKNTNKAKDKFDVIGITGVSELNAILDFPCVMLRYEHNMMAVIWNNINKLNKILIAIRKSFHPLPLRAA